MGVDRDTAERWRWEDAKPAPRLSPRIIDARLPTDDLLLAAVHLALIEVQTQFEEPPMAILLTPPQVDALAELSGYEGKPVRTVFGLQVWVAQ